MKISLKVINIVLAMSIFFLSSTSLLAETTSDYPHDKKQCQYANNRNLSCPQSHNPTTNNQPLLGNYYVI